MALIKADHDTFFIKELVDEFASLVTRHDKIILFGYGPSSICAQYFEYKLRLCEGVFVVMAPDETSMRSMVDDSSLVAVFTTTGRYRSFESMVRFAKSRGAEVVIVSEEFNPQLHNNCDRYMVLSHYNQPDNLEPHQKTRTVFFIFIEQVVQRMLQSQE